MTKNDAAKVWRSPMAWITVVCTAAWLAVFYAVFWHGYAQGWLFIPIGVLTIAYIYRDEIEYRGKQS